MDTTYTPKDAVIDTVAIALIIFPEPATTALGLAMMARPRGKNKQTASPATPHPNYPAYAYKVDVIRGREITWQAKMTMPGQLPLPKQNKPQMGVKQRESVRLNCTASYQQAYNEAPSGLKLPRTIKGTIHPIHHTIENSPAYIRLQANRTNQSRRDTTIHHSIANSPAAQMNNPIKIDKPLEIRQHRTINTKPSVNQWETLIPPPPTRAKRNSIEKDTDRRR